MTDHPLPDTEWAYLHRVRHDLKMRVLMNRLYQQERARRMELREGGVKAASLIAGSVAVAAVTTPDIVRACAAVIFAGTAASLVFGWGNKARDAGRRAAEWIALDRDIAAAGERHFTEVQLNAWMARCNEIEAGEPAANEVLLECCYRKAAEALGVKPAEGGAPTWRPVFVLP